MQKLFIANFPFPIVGVFRPYYSGLEQTSQAQSLAKIHVADVLRRTLRRTAS
jgi:hypothetical protein